MSNLPRWYSLEAERLQAENERLRDLLRLCLPSLRRDGRPHVITMVYDLIGSESAEAPSDEGGPAILSIYDMPDGTKERIVKEGKERYRETSNDGLHWSRHL